MMRKMTSAARFGAMPQRNDASVKPAVDSISRRLRPNVDASQPVIGRMIALATRYDVSAQVASSVVADRLLAMCGSETLTTVVSSTSMNVANMTAIATIHGLTRGTAAGPCGCEAACGGIALGSTRAGELISYKPLVSPTCPAAAGAADPALRRAQSSPARAVPLSRSFRWRSRAAAD